MTQAFPCICEPKNSVAASQGALTPKEAFVGVVRPGRRIAQFSLELQNVPGKLAAASEILARHNVNILSGYHDPGRWSCFVDLTDCDCGVDQLQDELASLDGVSDIVNVESSNGVLVDSLHFPLMWGKHRVVMLHAQTMNFTLNQLMKIFGQESRVAKVLLYQLGEAAGKGMYTATREEVGEGIRNELINIMNVYSASGWGIFRASETDFETAAATVVALENFECEFFRGAGSQPRSNFVRGHLAGLFTALFEKRVSAVETACLAAGHSYCEFKIAPIANTI